jgi:hypothetical protein
MIRAYDISNQKYLNIRDYIASIADDDSYGLQGLVTVIATHVDGIVMTCTDHGLVKGQAIVVSDTANYDGPYDIENVVDKDKFTLDVTFVANETATFYPVLDSDYYLAFLHGVEELFTNVKKFTALKGKILKDGQGNNMVEEYALTEDRRDIFMMLLNQAADKVSSPFIAYAKNILNWYKFNSLVNLDGTSSDGIDEDLYYIQFTINEDRDYQVQDQLFPLDAKIQETLISYVLKEWWRICGLMNDYTLEEQRFNNLGQELRSALMKVEGTKALKQTLV